MTKKIPLFVRFKKVYRLHCQFDRVRYVASGTRSSQWCHRVLLAIDAPSSSGPAKTERCAYVGNLLQAKESRQFTDSKSVPLFEAATPHPLPRRLLINLVSLQGGVDGAHWNAVQSMLPTYLATGRTPWWASAPAQAPRCGGGPPGRRARGGGAHLNAVQSMLPT
jgi:hypothetical protein